MNHLYLVRHGENLANLTKEFSHRKVDYSLTPKGVLQAQQTAEFFRDKPVDEIYTSPLKRAAETAHVIAAVIGLPVTTLEQFREINVGDLEGQTPTAEIWAMHNCILDGWFDGSANECFPGGEDYQQLLARAMQGFRMVLEGKSGRNIVIVAHGGIFWLTLCKLCPEIDPSVIARTIIPNCGITEIEASVENGRVKGRLLSYAGCAHLSGEAANLISGVPAKGELK